MQCTPRSDYRKPDTYTTPFPVPLKTTPALATRNRFTAKRLAYRPSRPMSIFIFLVLDSQSVGFSHSQSQDSRARASAHNRPAGERSIPVRVPETNSLGGK